MKQTQIPSFFTICWVFFISQPIYLRYNKYSSCSSYFVASEIDMKPKIKVTLNSIKSFDDFNQLTIGLTVVILSLIALLSHLLTNTTYCIRKKHRWI